MKILLLNDNPVVNKLVTLSAQKTADELEIVTEYDAIAYTAYDLLIIDDSLYEDGLLDKLKNKIQFMQSLYICSRDAQEVEGFSKVLKKPFLPTDLVEIFATVEEGIANGDYTELDNKKEDDGEFEDFNLEELGEELSEEDTFTLDEPESLEDETFGTFDEIKELDDGMDTLEDIDDNMETFELENESILDNDEAQKVKEELDNLEFDMSLDMEDEADADIGDTFTLDDGDLESLEEDTSTTELNDKDDEIAYDMALDLEDEADEMEDIDLGDDALENVGELEEFDLEEEVQEDEELENDNIEEQIQSAVEELSPEELASEVDEDLLLDIASKEIDPLETLNEKDIKLALGEDVSEEVSDDTVDLETSQQSEETNGVDALKNILEVLSDKKVLASLKDAKISINITIGGN